MRFFDIYGSPIIDGEDGDIQNFDYLFLGDYVDRGSHSLETICLLLALKVKYPKQVHLIRGNHEDKICNTKYGFKQECSKRLQENTDDNDSVYNQINDLFTYLPLAALIDNSIFCVHGGIGKLVNINHIYQLSRPLKVPQKPTNYLQQIVIDILWSDPTENDKENGIHPSMRDLYGNLNIVQFGPDRVEEFLEENNLSLIIRAHEVVQDGIQKFAGGKLITVFSATDYCGIHKNAGALLIIKQSHEIIPKLIYPQNKDEINWQDNIEQLQYRPPTPPRWLKTRQKSFN